MSKNKVDLRFAVRSHSGQISSVWRLWATRHGDVYLATRNMAKIEKFSFHKSGICRSAFTGEHGTPETMTDRAMFKWKRLPTPEAGEGKASRVAWLAFPTDYLSRRADHPVEINWIEAAPPGGATYVELAFTSESRDFIEEAFSQRQERRLLLYANLLVGESVYLSYYHSDWENGDLKVPGDGKVSDLVFSASDPYETGRPIRIRLCTTPSDGDALVMRELGGYAVPGTASPDFKEVAADERF
jgi:hypothetical protein